MRNKVMCCGRRFGMAALPILFLLSTAVAAADITIANAGTENPTLLYQGRPMLKAGPLPEVALFAVEWGSKDFPHRQWMDWMQEHRLGYGLWQAMAKHPQWRELHREWVQHILDAAGDNGNVIIDLMNEGAFKNALTKDWIETTLDIIEEWEQRTGNDLLVGIDFDHFYKKNDPGLEYALSHPRMELLICEGSEGHILRELVAGSRRPPREEVALKYRQHYRKPVISTNSPGRAASGSLHPGYNLHEAADELRLYQWYSMMIKVQGVGVYAKTSPLDWESEKVRQYARDSRILMDFFDTLEDYTVLKPEAARIVTGPGKYRANMASDIEAVVYLHGGEYGQRFAAGERLVVGDLTLASGKVSATLLHPATGANESREATVRGGRLEILLPAFEEDLAVHIRSE